MTIGRPTEFDRQVALEKSMDLFWRNGYEATSLTDLLREMGIGRQSLYNTFGDKHSLFVEALRVHIDFNLHPKNLNGESRDRAIVGFSRVNRKP